MAHHSIEFRLSELTLQHGLALDPNGGRHSARNMTFMSIAIIPFKTNASCHLPSHPPHQNLLKTSINLDFEYDFPVCTFYLHVDES